MKYLRMTIIIIMFTFLLLPHLLDFKAEAADRNDYIKVGLKFGSSSVTSCTLKSEDGFLLGTAVDRGFAEGMPLPAYGKLVVTNENGAIVIRDENGVLLSSDLGSSGCIMPSDYREDGIVLYEETPYRGGIMLQAKADGTLTVINYVTLEHYVYGVLNSELHYTNPIEALKAQAVAARSFGEMNLKKHSADGFDLCATTHCQVYKGFSGEYPSTVLATDETRGEMIYSNGSPVTAFYFKNSGGYTQNVEDVWAYRHPYLRSVRDEYCPIYPWSTSLSFDTISQKLEAAGCGAGTIRSISIIGRNSTGAVSELQIVGSSSTVTLQKEKIRNVLGATIIKSLMFQLGDSYTEAAGGSTAWKISNGFTAAKPETNVYLVSGNGTVTKSENTAVYGSNGTSTVKLGGTAVSEIVTGGTVSFSGYGYGHGVGMPQDSAVEMAKKGFSYDKILKYYFTDVEIR